MTTVTLVNVNNVGQSVAHDFPEATHYTVTDINRSGCVRLSLYREAPKETRTSLIEKKIIYEDMETSDMTKEIRESLRPSGLIEEIFISPPFIFRVTE